MKEVYSNLKKEYNNSIILVKSGVFYVTYDSDASIMHRIFNYQIKNDRLGFPIKSVDKVKLSLEKSSINYIIYDGKIIENKTFENNKYDYNYCENKRKEYEENSKDLLLERIKFLIDSSSDNYDKIRKYINEF